MVWLRSALFNVYFFGLTFLIGLVGVGVRWLAPARTLWVARQWARLLVGGARWLCGIRVAVSGLERIPPGPALLASQHQSAFDTLIWAVLLPRFAYVFKRELGRIPLFGPMLEASGQIPIDRDATVASVRALLAATRRAKENGRQIVIFPEGTRVAAGGAAPVRGGFALIAQRTGLPILPVATDSGRCWGRRAFLKRPGCIHIHVGEPIAPDLPSGVLLATLQQRWNDAQITFGDVDKVVDASAKRLEETGLDGSEAGVQVSTAPDSVASREHVPPLDTTRSGL